MANFIYDRQRKPGWGGGYWVETELSRNIPPCEIWRRNTAGRGSSQYKDPTAGTNSVFPRTERRQCYYSLVRKDRPKKWRGQITQGLIDSNKGFRYHCEGHGKQVQEENRSSRHKKRPRRGNVNPKVICQVRIQEWNRWGEARAKHPGLSPETLCWFFGKSARSNL